MVGGMKVLITGIAGFVGAHCANALARRGCDVVGVDNFNDYYSVDLKRARIGQLEPGVRHHAMDIADAPALAALVQREAPDVVLHLAAQAGVRYSLDNPFAYAQSNLLGHLSVLEACRHAPGLSHLVYASSSSVYGGNGDVPYGEGQRVDAPVSLYAATKRADELMSASYAHLYGLKQVGLRFFTVYGPWGRPDMAYWIFTEKVLRGEPIRVFNHGKMRRDFTYIDDIVAGVCACVTRPPEPLLALDRPHKIYNIGNNNPVALLDMIETLEDLLGRAADRQLEPMQPGDVVETFANIDAIRADYGFEPTTDLRDGLGEFVTWYREHHLVKPAVHAP